MAALSAQDVATRDRIITHMNADHQDSIQRYLQHHHSALFFQTRTARLTDITPTEMRFSYGWLLNTQATIPFSPPLPSLRSARERLVQMDSASRTALGHSDIKLTSFAPCYGHTFHFVNFTQCLLTYLAFCSRANFRPGALLYDGLLYRYPAFVRFAIAIQPYLFWIMLAIHVVESVVMARKVRRHGATPYEGLWWKWVGTCFVEGVTSFWRLEGVLEEERRKGGKKE